MKNILLIFSVIIGFSACESQNKTTPDRKNGYEVKAGSLQDSLEHEVMEGHDIAMARMIKISKHLTRIQQQLDSMNKLPESKIDKEYQQTLLDLQEDLNYAEYGMNKWMEEFKMDSGKDDIKKRVAYLESEKKKVLVVKEAILSGVARADSLFGKVIKK
jgi:hypothetical protein